MVFPLQQMLGKHAYHSVTTKHVLLHLVKEVAEEVYRDENQYDLDTCENSNDYALY